MFKKISVISVAAACLLACAGVASAQQKSGDWKFNVYPVLAWVPTNVGIDVNVPRDIGGGSGRRVAEAVPASSTVDRGLAVRRRLPGGFSATNGTWRVDADGLWVAVGGDRPDRPNLDVNADVIYGHGAVGVSVFKDLFVTGGVRRFALKYEHRDRGPARVHTQARACGTRSSASPITASARSSRSTASWRSAGSAWAARGVRCVGAVGLEARAALRADRRATASCASSSSTTWPRRP